MREDVMREGGTLPPGWVWTTVGDLYHVLGGGTPSTEVADYWMGTIPWITSADIHGLQDIRPRRHITDQAIQDSATTFVPAGSLIVVTRVALGRVALAKFPLCFSQDSQALIGDSSVVASDYALYYLSEAVQSFKHMSRGTTISGVTKRQLRELPFALPPLPEQRRIVAEIEKQFTRLDAGVTALKRVQANLKRYRASVLKAACEGRLAPQDPADEPADRLLVRILAEQRAKWQVEHPGKKYIEPAAPLTDGLPELPVGWCWARAEQLCDFITKGTTPSADKLFSGSGDVPFIKVYNLTDRGNLDFNVNPAFVSRQTHIGELARSRVYPGDVLMNIVGPPLGKVSIVPDQHPEWNVNQAIAIFRPMPSYNRRFLCHCLLTEQMLAWAIRRAKATAGQFNLTLEICRDLPLPVPHLAEQHRIVAEVERRLSVVAELEATVAANLARAGRLRQAVLKRAFEGRLVAQNADDEPAEVLLARVR